MPITQSGADVTERHASLFRNGRNQAVRIPREFEMEGTEVLIRKEGDRLILTPIRKNRMLDLLASWPPRRELARSGRSAAADAGSAVMAVAAWMLDTNTPSDLICNPRGSIVQRLAATDPDAICTSIVVACELRFGAKSKGAVALTNRFEQLLA